MRKLLLLYLLVICNIFNSLSQKNDRKLKENEHKDSVETKIWTETIGRFTITSHDSVEIIAYVDKVKYIGQGYDYPDADISVKFTNTEGKVLYIRNLPSSNNSIIGIASIDLNGIGKVIGIIYDQFPCYGTGCDKLQILGFNDIGYLVPFTGMIPLDMSFNLSSLVNLKMNGKCLEIPGFRLFCQLKTFLYYYIDKFGIFSENAYNETIFEKFPIQYQESSYQSIENIDDDRYKSPIKLYSKPDTTSSNNLIILKKNTIIKYIDGYHRNSDFWVHLRINGNEGFILWNDLYYLGLDACD